MDCINQLHKANRSWICEGHIAQNKAQVEKMKEICLAIKPTNILEIGFNAGHSSALMLEHTNACIVSVDLCEHAYTYDGKEMIDNIFPERHILIKGNSTEVLAGDEVPHLHYDIIFIDGGHSYNVCKSDLIKCEKYASPDTIIIVDDIVYEAEYVKRWNKQVTKVWNEMVSDGFVVEQDYFYFGRGKGVAVGRYNL